MDTLFPPFSPSNLGQIGYQRIVLKSACHEDSKTPLHVWFDEVLAELLKAKDKW